MPEKDKMMELLEWYETAQEAPAVSNVDDTIAAFVKGPEADNGNVVKKAVEVEVEKKEEPKPEEKKEQLDKWLEMYKAFALLKILENKFVMLSGELNASDEDKEKAKADIKMMIDKMKKVVNAL